MSSLCFENACPYSAHSSLNFWQMSPEISLSCRWTLQCPGTSAGEQRQYQMGFQAMSHASGAPNSLALPGVLLFYLHWQFLHYKFQILEHW